MVEYLIIETRYYTTNTLQNQLNVLAKDGWHVVCVTNVGLVLERLVPVIIEDNSS